ncbi:MAG: Lpg1974 family pore-forming outer membrane protein [Chlamydiales bacterium]|nr:Lpg1974 family pore-forming outer membrane protein [Chlamydiales bacterium]
MNRHLTLITSLLLAASAFGTANQPEQKECPPTPCCKPAPQKECPPAPCCDPLPQIKLVPGYNAPARVETCDSWDVYTGASFIYWQARQDDMELCASDVSTSGFPFLGGAGSKTTGSIINHDFTYKPGFKILAGVNFNHDHWEGYAEYTWFSSTTHSSATRETPTSDNPGVALSPLNGNPRLLPLFTFNTGKQTWDLSFQSLNTVLARAHYVGEKLIFRTIFGPKFVWISQKKQQHFIGDGTSGSFNATFDEKQNFAFWGAGLLAGLDTSWMLGKGFRIIGDGSVDLLYTRVQTTNAKQMRSAAGTSSTIFAFPDARPDFLMPHADLEFGFGWDSYFNDHAYHVDLLATYGFQVFWGANLFRHFNDNVQPANSNLLNGNLYLHGLTAAVKIDF